MTEALAIPPSAAPPAKVGIPSQYPSRLRSVETVNRMQELMFGGSAYSLAKALRLPFPSTVYQWKVGKPRISSRYAVDMVHLALDALEAERAKH